MFFMAFCKYEQVSGKVFLLSWPWNNFTFSSFIEEMFMNLEGFLVFINERLGSIIVPKNRKSKIWETLCVSFKVTMRTLSRCRIFLIKKFLLLHKLTSKWKKMIVRGKVRGKNVTWRSPVYLHIHPWSIDSLESPVCNYPFQNSKNQLIEPGADEHRLNMFVLHFRLLIVSGTKKFIWTKFTGHEVGNYSVCGGCFSKPPFRW